MTSKSEATRAYWGSLTAEQRAAHVAAIRAGRRDRGPREAARQRWRHADVTEVLEAIQRAGHFEESFGADPGMLWATLDLVALVLVGIGENRQALDRLERRLDGLEPERFGDPSPPGWAYDRAGRLTRRALHDGRPAAAYDPEKED